MLTPAALARAMHEVSEPFHAYLYFAPEVQAAWETYGLEPRGQGYVVCRVAPMGEVGPKVAAATFFNFHPMLFEMALPGAWDQITPAQAVEARSDAIEVAFLRRLHAPTDGLAEATELALEAISACEWHGRPLAAANAQWPLPGSPFADLFQAITVLREYRGDGHVSLLTASGLHPTEALALYAAWQSNISRRFYQGTRLWDDAAWEAAEDRLRARGWMDAEGALTAEGVAWRDDIERRTDELASAPYEHLGEERTLRLFDLLVPMLEAMNDNGAFKRPVDIPARPA